MPPIFLRSLAFAQLGLSLLVIGCQRDSTASRSQPENVTYCHNIAPLLFQHCATCHREGEVAPFSLLTYAAARSRGQQIVEITQQRVMPPWLPQPGEIAFAGERRLSDEEIKLFEKWVAAGMPEGDPADLPPAPRFTDGWQLGPPDRILNSPVFELEAAGPDRFRNFVLETTETESHWIRAVELRPENPHVTHHARLGIDASHEAIERDAADDQPGYEGMAWGQEIAGELITWTPGISADAGTLGTAWRWDPDSRLVLHTHLQTTGKPEQVRFRVGLYFADKPPDVRPLILRIGSRDIDLPAGAAHVSLEDRYELPVDVDLHFLFPHAHKLCQQIEVEATLPRGERRPILRIDSFDEKWHDKYRLARPLRLPQGTQLVSRFTYDNSAANPRNPYPEPRRIVYGSNANDEMSDVFLQVTLVDPAQRKVLEEHQKQAELRSKVIGFRKTLEQDPDDRWSIEALASCYVALQQPALASELLHHHPSLVEGSLQAKTILAMALLANRETTQAEQTFRDILKSDPQPLAWLGLGQALNAQQKWPAAEEAFQAALQAAPRMTVAALDLADLYLHQERWAEAAQTLDRAIALDPEEPLPRLKQAQLLAQQTKYEESLASFAAAKQLAPYLYAPATSLAIACYEKGDEAQARLLLQQEVTRSPLDPATRLFLGQIARRDAKWKTARDQLRRANELPLPTTWPASHVRQFRRMLYAERLQLAQQLQDADLAREVLQAWVILEPDNAQLRETAKQLPASQNPAQP